MVSPNGKWVAYISKGFVCVCNIDDPKPQRLSEVPNTWTHVLAEPKYAFAEGDSNAVFRSMNREQYQKWVASIAHTVVSLQWTQNGDGVVFAYEGPDPDGKTSTCEIRQVSLAGKARSLAKMDVGIAYSGHEPEFYLTHDRKCIVLPNHLRPRPLIWDLSTNKPRATPFTNLMLSATSDRWLGVEKDTKDLVITDANFQITNRFGNLFPPLLCAQELLWSPDERYVIWKYQVGFDYYSNWEGGWIDLQTGEQKSMTGSYIAEIVRFTGRDGEFMRIGGEGKQGQMSGLITTGFHFQFFKSGDAKPEDVWSVHFDPNNRTITRECPDIRFIYFSSDYKLFAFGLPRPYPPPAGEIFHLMDRAGELWKLPGKDNGQYFSPYEVVCFAEGGKSIIAHDSRRLFAIPVSAVMNDAMGG